MKPYFWPVFLLLSFAGVAQQTTPKPPPAITEAQKAAYFKAQSELLSAQIQANRAMDAIKPKESALKAASDAIVAACGTTHHANLSAAGDPECVENPKPEAKK